MGTSQAVAGIGTLLQRKDNLGAWQTLAEITNITGPGLGMETIDVTHMESPDNVREIIASFKTPGEVTYDANFNPTLQSFKDVLNDWKNRAKAQFRIVWPVTPVVRYAFSAFVTSFEPGAAVDDKLTCSVGLTIASAPDFNAAA